MKSMVEVLLIFAAIATKHIKGSRINESLVIGTYCLLTVLPNVSAEDSGKGGHRGCLAEAGQQTTLTTFEHGANFHVRNYKGKAPLLFSSEGLY